MTAWKSKLESGEILCSNQVEYTPDCIISRQLQRIAEMCSQFTTRLRKLKQHWHTTCMRTFGVSFPQLVTTQASLSQTLFESAYLQGTEYLNN